MATKMIRFHEALDLGLGDRMYTRGERITSYARDCKGGWILWGKNGEIARTNGDMYVFV